MMFFRTPNKYEIIHVKKMFPTVTLTNAMDIILIKLFGATAKSNEAEFKPKDLKSLNCSSNGN